MEGLVNPIIGSHPFDTCMQRLTIDICRSRCKMVKDTCLLAASEESSSPRIPASGNPRKSSHSNFLNKRPNVQAHKQTINQCNEQGCENGWNRKRMRF